MIKKVGQVIKERRQEVGMTKAEFARRLKCKPQNIDSLEMRKSIDFELAQKICMVLKFDLFESYRVFKSGKTREEVMLNKELESLKGKYIELLEKYSSLLLERAENEKF